MNRIFFALLAALPLAACMFSSSADEAAQERVTNCRNACDKMKFFDCNTADDHATCYDQCRTANAQQVDTFTACAKSSICDAACRGAIVQKPAAPAASPGTGSTVVVDPTAPKSNAPVTASPLCEKVCAKLVTCGAAAAADMSSCLTKCGATAGADTTLTCIANAACPDLNKCSPFDVGGGTNGLPSFEIMMCTQQCDVLHTSTCLSADEHAACTGKCNTAASIPRSTFTSCAQGTGSDCERAKPCFTTFNK